MKKNCSTKRDKINSRIQKLLTNSNREKAIASRILAMLSKSAIVIGHKNLVPEVAQLKLFDETRSDQN